MVTILRPLASGAISVAMLSVLMLSLTAAVASSQDKSISARQPPKKIMDAVAVIHDAKSLDEINRALKAVEFSESEMQQLGDEVKRRNLHTKLEELRKSAEATKAKSPPVKAFKPDQVLQQKRSALSAQRSQLIRSMNQQAFNGKPKGDPVVRSRTVLSAPPRILTRSQVESLTVQAETRSGLTGTGMSVAFTNVPAGRVGEDMTVEGRGFGSTRGRVALIVGRQLFECPVSTWVDTRVTFRLTRELEPYIGYNPLGREVLVWFKEPGRETGPTTRTIVLPDLATINPTITSIVPGEITPGQSVLITGENFIRHHIGRRPTVDFIFPDRTTVQGIVQDSGYEFIQVKFPDDFGGKTRSQIRVVVKNTIALTTQSNLTFVPAEEIVYIKSESYMARSLPRGILSFMSLFGQSHTHTLHDWQLKNEWVVEDCHLEVHSSGANSGAFYELRPTAGSDLAKAIITVWADAYSTATCWDHLYLRGPRGVPYE